MYRDVFLQGPNDVLAVLAASLQSALGDLELQLDHVANAVWHSVSKCRRSNKEPRAVVDKLQCALRAYEARLLNMKRTFRTDYV